MKTRKTLVERFYDKIFYSPDGCWYWTGAVKETGYGYFHVQPHNKNVYAHRFSYHISKGLIPIGFCLLHSCDNPLCVNPDHLNPGTQQENIKDMFLKGRAKGPLGKRWKCPKRLDENGARDVKRMLSIGHTPTQISKSLNVPIHSVLNIRHNKTWMHVTLNLLICLFIVSSCTEEIIKVEKHYDTVFVEKEKFVDRYFSSTDTVTITQVLVPTRSQTDTVFQYVYDTVYLQRIDTLWITKTETNTVYDTIVERVYGDTLVLWTGGSYSMIPEELQVMNTAFFDEAYKRGLNPPGGMVIMVIKDLGAVEQSYSHDVDDFHIIVLNSRFTWDECFIPLWRELSIWQLGNDFSYDPTSVFYPLYPTNQIRWSNRSQYPAQVNQFFQ